MFLLVSVRHVEADPGEHQYSISTQISISLGEISSDISYTKYSCDLNLGEGLCICTSFHFPDSGLYLSNGFDFDFDLFWMAWHWKPAIHYVLWLVVQNEICLSSSTRNILCRVKAPSKDFSEELSYNSKYPHYIAPSSTLQKKKKTKKKNEKSCV